MCVCALIHTTFYYFYIVYVHSNSALCSRAVKSSKSESIEVMEDEQDAAAMPTHAHSKEEAAVPLAPPSQESPQGSTTASPQTDSPVLVNADVHMDTHSLLPCHWLVSKCNT